MDYTKKHKDLIAKLFKKVGMLKEAKIVLSCDEYKYDIGKAMRDAVSKTKTGIGANPALLDAARRYETRECAILRSALYLIVKAEYGAISTTLAEAMGVLVLPIVIWVRVRMTFL